MIEKLNAIQAAIAQMRTIEQAHYVQIMRLMHFQVWMGAAIAVLQTAVLALAIHTVRLQRKIKGLLSIQVEMQDKLNHGALERIELLEKCVGLRQIVPEDAPPPPQVLM